MDFFKFCPTCNTKNNAADMLCSVCMADISAILPQDPVDNLSLTEKTILENTTLFLLFLNGVKKQIQNGDIVGRNLLGADVLQEYKTISRKHARFTFEKGKWYVEDLASSNGVYLDNERISANTKVEIKNKQKLGISKSFEIEVLIS